MAKKLLQKVAGSAKVVLHHGEDKVRAGITKSWRRLFQNTNLSLNDIDLGGIPHPRCQWNNYFLFIFLFEGPSKKNLHFPLFVGRGYPQDIEFWMLISVID